MKDGCYYLQCPCGRRHLKPTHDGHPRCPRCGRELRYLSGMDSWEWCLQHPVRREKRPAWYQRPAQELQVFSEDALWFRRNSPHIEP
eukprot:9910926-Lingulodinium_polyedra.AAC.1